MKTDRRKNAALAINAVLRGLEFDQVAFHYDETGRPDVGFMAGARSFASARLELPPLERTTTAA